MASNEKDDDELTIPRAAINKLIKEKVPDIRVSNDSRELIIQCCTEFIHKITTEANSICESQQKKTMSAEHALIALERTGFTDLLSEAETVLNDCKGKRRRQSTRLEHLGIPEEELFRQQQELFAQARLEQERIAQQEWLQMQNNNDIAQSSLSNLSNEEEEYES